MIEWERIREAGIVGAGGAGFPTHRKLTGCAEIIIANGAECEPLLETDRHLMLRELNMLVDGLRIAMTCTGAQEGIIALKEKHHDILYLLEARLKQTKENIRVHALQNFYPAGDEQVLVYEAAGRVVPMGGIPLEIGVIVCNVYTLFLIAEAQKGRPFTHRFVTVTGEVKRPAVAKVPIGMSLQEVVDEVGGGAAIPSYRVIVGGPMMGKLQGDLRQPLLKTTNGVLVLPADHKVVRMKELPTASAARRAKSVCCQCSFCTEMCPRYLLGHHIHPHKSMRMLSGSGESISMEGLQQASLCSDCGLCSVYSCTMGLAPNLVHQTIKEMLRQRGIKPDFRDRKLKTVHPFREYRKVFSKRLISRLNLERYERHLPFLERDFDPSRLVYPLKQHIGSPSVPLVKKGDHVRKGELIAGMPEESSISVNLHSSMSGVVTEVSDRIVVERL